MLNKKVLSIGMCFLLLGSMSVPVLTAEAPEYPSDLSLITSRYIYINNAYSTLAISDGTATIKGFVQKTTSGESIYLSSTLQQYSNDMWSDIKSWSKSSTASSVSISEKFTVSKGKFRVATYYSVSGPDGSESNTVYSRTVTY